jgi:hypothetical protein
MQRVKEIGKITRKSMTLTQPSVQTKPVVDIVERVLQPFLGVVLSGELVKEVTTHYLLL